MEAATPEKIKKGIFTVLTFVFSTSKKCYVEYALSANIENDGDTALFALDYQDTGKILYLPIPIEN